MKTLTQYIAEHPDLSPSDTLSGYLAQPPEPRPSGITTTYATYLSIGQLLGNNVAGAMRETLLAWSNDSDLSQLNPALPNPGVLRSLHARLDGYPGVDLSTPDAPAMLALFSGAVNVGRAPIISAESAARLLAIGFVTPEPATLDDVQTEKAKQARAAAANAAQSAAAARWNEFCAGVDAYRAGVSDVLPTL